MKYYGCVIVIRKFLLQSGTRTIITKITYGSHVGSDVVGVVLTVYVYFKLLTRKIAE